MKKLMSYAAIAVIGLNINLPAQAIRVSANDIVCYFKYKVGDDAWVLDSTGGTTRAQARRFRTQVLQRLERKANDAGQEFKVVHTGCRDPFGHN